MHSGHASTAVAALLLAALGAPLNSQNKLDPVTEAELGGAWFGSELLGMSDLTGDGLPELAVAQSSWFRGLDDVVFLLSGASRRVLLELRPPEPCGYFGAALAELGDRDGDEVPELAVGAFNGGSGEPGFVFVFSGRTGALLETLRGVRPDDCFGSSLASAGDVNGDGMDDLVVGAPGWSSPAPSYVRVHSGADGSVLLHVDAEREGDRYGQDVAGGLDLDGDGVPDLVVGAPQPWPAYEHPGYVDLISGASGENLVRIRGRWGAALFDRDRDFGDSVLMSPDLNGDGQPEVVVGVTMDGGERVPHVAVHSGRDGALLWRIPGEPGSSFARDLALTPELLPSGVPGIVIGAAEELIGDGAVYLHAADGSRRMARVSLSNPDWFYSLHLGTSVAALRDLNGDGWPDFAAGNITHESPFREPGAVRAYSGADGALLRSLTREDLVSPGWSRPGFVGAPFVAARLVSLLTSHTGKQVPTKREPRLFCIDGSTGNFPGVLVEPQRLTGSDLVPWNGAWVTLQSSGGDSRGELFLVTFSPEDGVRTRLPLGIEQNPTDEALLVRLPAHNATEAKRDELLLLVHKQHWSGLKAYRVTDGAPALLGTLTPWPWHHGFSRITSVRGFTLGERGSAPEMLGSLRGFVVSGISSRKEAEGDHTIWRAGFTLAPSGGEAVERGQLGSWHRYPPAEWGATGISGACFRGEDGRIEWSELLHRRAPADELELIHAGGTRTVPGAVQDALLALELSRSSRPEGSTGSCLQGFASPHDPRRDAYLVTGLAGEGPDTVLLDASGDVLFESRSDAPGRLRSAWCLDAAGEFVGALIAPDREGPQEVTLVSSAGSQTLALPRVGGAHDHGLGEGVVLLAEADPLRFTLVLGGLLNGSPEWGTNRSAVLFVELKRAEDPISDEPWSMGSTRTVWIK